MTRFTLQVIDHDAKSVSTFPQLTIADDAPEPLLKGFARDVAKIVITLGGEDLFQISAEELTLRYDRIKAARAKIANVFDIADLTRFIRALSSRTVDYALVKAGD